MCKNGPFSGPFLERFPSGICVLALQKWSKKKWHVRTDGRTHARTHGGTHTHPDLRHPYTISPSGKNPEIEIDKLWKQSQTQEKYIFVGKGMRRNKVDWTCQQRALSRACVASKTLWKWLWWRCFHNLLRWVSQVVTCDIHKLTQYSQVVTTGKTSLFPKVSDAMQALKRDLCWHGQSTLF